MTANLLPMLAAASVGGMGVAVWKYFHTKKAPHGDEKTMEIADTIQSGAIVFLKTEYKVISVFIALVFGALAAFVNG